MMAWKPSNRIRRSLLPAFDAAEKRVLCTGFAVTVPGTANPYLADTTNSTGPAAAIDGTTPPSVTVTGLDRLTFTVSGETTYYPFDLKDLPRSSPDGGAYASSLYGSRGGISSWNLPITSLAGVFLGAQTSAAPGPFTGENSAPDLAPQLGQVFFIGDGLTGTATGARQVVHVPAGATRLFLANIDGYEWGNNGGAYDVTITVPPPVVTMPLTLTLKSAEVVLNQPVGFGVTTTGGKAVANSTLEIRPAGSSTWIPLPPSDSAKGRLTPRRAGHIEVRASAKVGEQTVTSDPVALNVLFPTYAMIVADKHIRGLMDQYWRRTINFARDHRGPLTVGLYPYSRRAEFGFFIILDTATGRYSTSMQFGGLANSVSATDGGESGISDRPADRVSADGRSAVYAVGLFHTHTPYTYTFPPLNDRLVGPSELDRRVLPANDVVGIVYDYVGRGGLIRRGDPLASKARLYAVGPDRRTSAR